jgi:hypothetical protein
MSMAFSLLRKIRTVFEFLILLLLVDLEAHIAFGLSSEDLQVFFRISLVRYHDNDMSVNYSNY